MRTVFKAMTIAGSDSGAGAGIQADLKTFAAFGVYGTSIITAVTAQNTQRVTQVLELPVAMIASQIDAVVQDIGTSAVKTGMLANAEIISTVAAKIREHGLTNLVVDPVMVAKGGTPLLRKDAMETLRSELIPLATIVTPNIPEAEELTGVQGSGTNQIKEAARHLIDMGARSVVIKGGHRKGPAKDTFYDGVTFRELSAARISTSYTHGTGCTYSAAIAANLARGATVEEAVAGAKKFITQAIRHGFPIGSGHSPVHHFYHFWKQK
ncbi:MAG: bifunctional hydroxymethylpyrimidine kinase/phosphomethylpyrimidine kinase [Deltaproteobacteria bacterium]|nr:bifunctional hydroxymethylpyrimidine kinase/phosphomethylpyrimidine kinase [Deltaproteobacteria bacterium]